MNEVIYYKSPVGILQIVNSGDAISSLRFLNTEKSQLTDESTIQFTPPVKQVLKDCTAQLDTYFSGSATSFTLPIVQGGSLFQQNVWKELCNIPFGQIRSYMDISKRLGNVKAVRAVGNANGKNDIAIIVPCHRVIGSKGNLVGYAGDLWRKQWLLEHEARYGQGVQKLF